MIRHPAILGRLHAAASAGSITGWTPPGLIGPDNTAHQREPEAIGPVPERQDWMYDHDWDRFLRHWRERQREGVAN